MDLKVKDVAEILGVSEASVRRQVAQGEIPAYRLNREYRFNRAEVEDWLLRKKQQLSVPLMQGEEMTAHGNNQYGLFRALHHGEVLHIDETDKERLIAVAMKEIERRFGCDATVLTELFLERERLMPTSLGNGIGVPHTRDFLLGAHFDVVLVVYPKKAIDYGALDSKAVHTLFFLFAGEDKRHLQLLAKLAYFCSQPHSADFLQTKPDKEALLEHIKCWEK